MYILFINMKRIERTKSNNATSRKEYKVLSNIIDQEPYWDEGLKFYPSYNRGFKNPNKQLMSFQIRMYKTWKHNRNNQYK